MTDRSWNVPLKFAPVEENVDPDGGRELGTFERQQLELVVGGSFAGPLQVGAEVGDDVEHPLG